MDLPPTARYHPAQRVPAVDELAYHAVNSIAAELNGALRVIFNFDSTIPLEHHKKNSNEQDRR